GAFQAALDTAMGANGTVTFANGVLTIGADAAGNGIVITDDPTDPATRASRSFSHTFGLNDLVTKGKPLNYATGFVNADQHGLTAGQTMKFAIRNTDGTIVRTIDFAVPAGAPATIGQLRTAMDTALAGYGQTQLDSNGRMTLVPTNNSVGRIDVLQDATVRGNTNLSLSDIFGLGETLPADRSRNLAINANIKANPNLLGSAQADLVGVLAGVRVLAPGDGRGALAVEAAASTPRSFADAGGLTGQVTSVTDYAARLAGHAGVRAEALDAAKSAAESVR